jgi:hypothetical protein
MVHALAAHYPFTNGERLVLYHPSPVENYFAVAPGIEVSVEPYDHTSARGGSHDSPVYDRHARMIRVQKKGHFIDSTL